MAQIELKNISKQFDNNVVIEDLDLQINDGEFLVLVGPSGCGKSTTLRLIAGLETATAGEIFIGDTMVNSVAPKDRNISMVFQNYALYPHMSVYDNMAFGLKLRKFKKNDIRQRVQETAEILEMTSLLDRKPKQLSGGQRQRVALGRAIIRKPQVFLFDEPLSNLDAKLRVQMRAEIKKLHKSLKTTMVYVTHDQVEAMTMGERIAVMKDGVIHQIDTPLKLYNEPADLFVASFIGSPSMNFIHSTLKEEPNLFAVDGNIKINIPPNHKKLLKSHIDKPIVIGIRPEDLSLNPRNENSVSISLRIDLFEPMGNETLIYLSREDTRLICRTPEFQPEADLTEELIIYLNTDKARYFDSETGKTIC
jgi:multiple sugar transport system ATP-binding protein